ncbi:helix-turn-helix domain-containing protein [Lactonifactor sp. BIOML-A3]|uniref:helix-turn-helix domain-containing protein n=1 Tax=unclassified Lactonifactor TaxID=2636670 RepID=UPI0012B02751|nr:MULTISPECIES: helix-turn-helix domain-containing protein [unclassified Lactonifactor]MSA01055.1 helix-turn-helix domain-containing protein [Lactonifactor sp. BIOML-A5]MSA10300.1 helix-turn-helix domain-containing protein [Lactonifactor sp. BIOML-A4]MSA13110.1 helix-turn-helix domain-containing protein [Lactonifactor sp. BIOML-A3]MSA19272.1 helix-turn-helix domain-containing protein [Lactonifactor sp. BIOML-A2]MSA38349.1 helix-turn-helix domain-containing protein [Lactonifactor sp. BIOML-A1]
MIKYKRDIIKMLSDKGITTYQIRKNKIFTESQLMQLRNNKLVTQETLDKLCTLLECQPGFLLEYESDEDMKKFEEMILKYIKK